VRRDVRVLLMAVVVGCGGDSTTPTPAGQLSGVWMYSATNLTQPGVTCSLSGISMTLAQSGNTFTGTVASGGTVLCRSPAKSDAEPLSSDVVANGIVNGSSVEFDIGDVKLHNVGSISADSMSGRASLQVVTDNGTSVLSGLFTAVKR
jgi:hypothetical protein